MSALLPEAVAAARWDWERASTYDGMLSLIRDIREKGTNWFGYHYTQLPLAFASQAAKIGDMELAARELDEYSASNRLDEAEATKLSRLLRDSGVRGMAGLG